MRIFMPNSVKKSVNRSDNITIRPAIQADLPAIIEIYNQNVITRQATADLTPVTVTDRQAWFDAHGMANNRPLLVAVDKADKILGWSTLSNLYERSAYHIAAEVSVYIDSEAKGRGLGQLLVENQLALAPDCGIKQVAAKIFAHNQPSLNLFKKLGFEEWGVLKQVCDLGDFTADVVILGRAV